MEQQIVIRALKGALEKALRAGLPNFVAADADRALKLAARHEAGEPVPASVEAR